MSGSIKNNLFPCKKEYSLLTCTTGQKCTRKAHRGSVSQRAISGGGGDDPLSFRYLIEIVRRDKDEHFARDERSDGTISSVQVNW